MSRAKKILERLTITSGEAKSSQGVQINEKVNVTPEMANSIVSIFKDHGYTVSVNHNTEGNVYIDGLYSCEGRYYGIFFDKQGFCIRKSYNDLSECKIFGFHDAKKLHEDLMDKVAILEKLAALDSNLV